MSASDDHLRSLRERRKRPPQEPEEAPKSAPLVSQGPRSAGMPIGRAKSPDDLIREAATRLSSPGGWTRIF